jgi:hypothetical protein
MRARTIHIRSVEETREALSAERTAGLNPVLAIVFASIKTDWRSIRDVLHEAGLDVLGATSCGEFTNGQQSEGAAAILLLDLPRDAYAIRFEDMHGRDVTDVARPLAASAFETFNRPAFIFCTTGMSAEGDMFPGAAFLRSLEEAAGPGVKMYGGMAGDDVTFTGTYVFSQEQESDVGVAALVFDEDKVSLRGMALSGWKPMGIARTVTRSEGDWLYAIDGQPALEMYLRYLGKVEGVDDVSNRIFDDIGIHYPFQAEGAGDPVMRTPIGSDSERNALRLDFGVPEGSTLRFSAPPDFDIVENVLEGAHALKRNAKADADAILVFSCAGRLSALGPLVNMENDGLGQIWGAPMAGFFTYGEYGPRRDGGQEFYSTTCCWVALHEKKIR